GEVCDAIVYLLENWERLDNITVADLMNFIQGPDFPTAGIVFTQHKESEDGLISAYATGRGKITIRAKAHIEELGRGRSRIVVTEIPYQTNKTTLIERIVSLVQDDRLEGIVDLRDESDRQGLRIVIEVGRHADPAEVLDQLFKYTPLQSTFGIIMLALVDGEPRMLGLKALLRAYIEHRLEVIRRRSEYDLARAQERAHILEGLITAIDNIDQAIDIIRRSRNTETAHTNLKKAFKLSDTQATAILEMQLRRLAALERRKLQDELQEKQQLIDDLTTLLGSAELMRMEVARETRQLRDDYADERQTIIARDSASEAASGVMVGGLDDTWVTLTLDGRLSIPYDGEPPKVSASMKEPPFRVAASNPSDILYLVTEDGQCATILTSNLPRVNDIEEGSAFDYLCDLPPEAIIAQVVSLPPRLEHGYLFFVSELGEVKRLRLEDLPGMRAKSFKVFDVEPGDRLRFAFWVDDNDTALLVTRNAQAIHFAVDDVRPSGLTAGGIRGIKLGDKDDRVVGAGRVGRYTHVWTVTDLGIGKRTAVEDYPTQGRAGQGVRTMKLPPGKNVGLAAALVGGLETEMVVLTTKGKAKRNRITNTPATRRDSKGEPGVVSLAKDEAVAEAYFFEPRLEEMTAAEN
ncbi:MAG: DNA gyrase subunit A, partial [Anaerolineales bacterium]